MLNRRHFIASLAAAAVQAQTNRPNIVFFLLDDAGIGDFGCYGQKHIKTPNFDRLAREGMRFTAHYAGDTVCAPSRSALMTGLHSGHGPIRANAGTAPIAASDATFVAMLKKAGYRTGGFGKWGLGDKGTTGDPLRHGFDEFFGYYHQIHAHSYYPEFLWDSGKRLDLGKKTYSADLIADRSVDFLRKKPGQPFFLYATYTLPHAQFEIPSNAPYSSEPWSEGAKNFAAMVSRSDYHFGRILKTLEDLKLADNTIVILTSDNGAPAGADRGYETFRSNLDLRGQKGQMYEGGIRVPLIVRWPGKVKPASQSAFPCAFWDFFPTLAEITGEAAPQGLDGVSLIPTLTGKGVQRQRECLYWELYNWNAARGFLPNSMKQAARDGKWKAVREKPGGPMELFDLAADPGESRDVAAEFPDVARKMEAILKRAHAEPRPHTGGTSTWVSE